MKDIDAEAFYDLAGLEPGHAAALHFARELRIYRLRAGMRQHELADAIRYSRVLIVKIERGQRVPTADLCTRCDAVLNAGGAIERAGELVRALRGYRDSSVAAIAEQARELLAHIPRPRTNCEEVELHELRRRVPVGFALLGAATDGRHGWMIDAHGTVDPDGAVWVWPVGGEPAEAKRWVSVAEAAAAHSALILWAGGGVEDPAGIDDSPSQ